MLRLGLLQWSGLAAARGSPRAICAAAGTAATGADRSPSAVATAPLSCAASTAWSVPKTSIRRPVLLNQDVPGVGTAGDLVRVRRGFARNYLLRDGRGSIATREDIATAGDDLGGQQQRADAALASLRQKLAASVCIVKRQRKATSGINPVTAENVARALKTQYGRTLPASAFHMVPVSEYGHYVVPVDMEGLEGATIRFDVVAR